MTDIKHLKYEEISDELAQIETYQTSSELKTVLKRFYPDIQDGRDVTVFYFDLIDKITNTMYP